ncbi:oleate hydratase [Pedobacter cryoconitis]|uniref:Oleate hydratase n=1 Tax=Pedobacter cryoconitis TaxID=188932 RepID=A0A327SH51_9SPHI|nr:oleate hydratase [Pedobacter cryoconitis]RAJ28161.1 oleate hydratase [Pedobacter cryoconitis]
MSNINIDPKTRNAYFVGGGIASFAGAAFLIRDGKVPGKNITIFEESKLSGGSLDGIGQVANGYMIRGGRMLNFTYYCTYDLLSSIPSLTQPGKSVTEETHEFNEKIKTHANARLVDKEGQIVDVSSLGFTERDRIDLVELFAIPENVLGTKKITDWFKPEFFETNFWYMWSSMFAFEPWHSLVEFKRYVLRFVHEITRIDTLAGVDRTVYNQYDSIVLPMLKWLEAQGVNFVMGSEVKDIYFKPSANEHLCAQTIHYQSNGEAKIQKVAETDLVFVTNGSMTANSTLGSNHEAPVLNTKKGDGSWALWETLAAKHKGFGNPKNFSNRIEESKWESFTVTNKGTLFFDLVEKFSGNAPGTGALITFKDSSWMMSIVLAYQPHFINQPEGVTVFWGYGLFPDQEGDYVKKKMSDCTGEELMIELINHLKFNADQEEILEQANCIPCMLPYITAQFLTRAKGDRPLVIPEGTSNFAFLGQFAEVPDDVVFTVEYSVRTAQTAVYELLGLDKKAPDLYKGQHDIKVLYQAMKTMHA